MSTITTFYELSQVPTYEQELTDSLAKLDAADFPATAWQSGNPLRNLVEMDTKAIQDQKGLAYTIVKGGILDESTGDWLALLARSQWQNEKYKASAAEGVITVRNVSATPRTFQAGYFKVADSPAQGAKIFTNTTTFTVPASSTINVAVRAQVPGSSSNLPAGTLRTILTPQPGLTSDNPLNWLTRAGTDDETDLALRQRCRVKWGTLGTGSPESAYKSWAFTAGGGQVTKIKLLPNFDPTDPSRIQMLIAGPAGAVPAGVVGDVQTYISPSGEDGLIPSGAKLSVSSAVPHPMVLTGTVNVRAPNDPYVARIAINERLALLQRDKDIGENVYTDELITVVGGILGERVARDWIRTSPLVNEVLAYNEVPLFQNSLVIVQV